MTILEGTLPWHAQATPATCLKIDAYRRRQKDDNENLFEMIVRFGRFYLAGIELSQSRLSIVNCNVIFSVRWLSGPSG
jgi:hypothetical protein